MRKIPICYDDDDDEESSTPLRDIIISELPPCIAITPVLSTKETKDSLIMGDEHLNTISEKESDKFIKSSVENLVSNPSESEDERECDIDSFLDEFTGELIFLKSIPSGIDEADCDPEEEIRLIEKLLYDNSSPHYGHIKWIEDLVPRTMWIQEPVNYDKHALWGVSYWGWKRQQFYGFDVNRKSALDLPEEAQPYQARHVPIDLKRREAYTAYSNPRGFIYQNKEKKNRLMRIDEIHKFSNGTLNDVRNALDDRLKGIRMQYLP
nr:hypothetical protein [Tanacetum cinerariifolium]